MHSTYKKSLSAAALAVAAALSLAACGTDDSGGTGKSPVADIAAQAKTRAATVLDTPFTKPDFVLTDTHGKKFDFRERTKGKPTLIYFGYTHCPDICPLTMSNIAVARKALPPAERDKLQVVFVTTDPDRDTPSELGTWLKSLDPSFIGLTGDVLDYPGRRPLHRHRHRPDGEAERRHDRLDAWRTGHRLLPEDEQGLSALR